MAEPKNTDAPTGKRARRKESPPAAPLTGDEQRSLSLGIAFGMACAAALSAPTLYGLARLIGFTRALAWLLPAALDGYAVTSIWFGRRVAATHPAARGARRNARLALALTVACNGLYHLLTLGGVMIPAWARVTLLVAVSSLPPFLVDRLLHLRSLASGNTTTQQGAATPATPAQAAQRNNAAATPRAENRNSETPATPATQHGDATPPAPAPHAQRNTPAPRGRITQLAPHAERARIIAALITEHGQNNVTAAMVGEALGVDRSNGYRALQRYLGKQTGKPTQAPEAAIEDEPEPETVAS